MKMERSKSTVVDHKLKIDREDIIRALNKAEHLAIPETASVTFHVPGGGDWSNTTVDIDKDFPITVRWRTSE